MKTTTIKSQKTANLSTVTYRGITYNLTVDMFNEFKTIMSRLSSNDIPLWLSDNQVKINAASGKKVKFYNNI
jgi:hypothetical protein